MNECEILEQFAIYPFEADQAFQEGLARILSSAQPESTIAEDTQDILGRAKAFYFSTITGHQILWNNERHTPEVAIALSSPSTHQAHTEEQIAATGEEHVLSFADITALIESNQTHLIPNNETIPSATNEETPSTSKAETPKKPWERATSLDR